MNAPARQFEAKPGPKPIDPVVRFWQCISPEPNSGCWLWTGSVDKNGYGQIHILRKHVAAHRFSYELHRGNIPPGTELDHLCRVHCCVNPDHVEPVAHRENMRRSPVVGRWSRYHITHCPRGHEYTDDNTYLVKGRWRMCKECNREANKRYRKTI